MADDPRPEPRDPELARRLSVEPLDELTRRLLVTTALRERSPRTRHQRAWRVAVAAAAVLVVVVGAVALLTAPGGHDEPTALQERSKAPASSAAPSAPVAVGDFGDLDRPANLEALRTRLAADASTKPTPAPLADATAGAVTGAAGAAPESGESACPLDPPAGATVLGAGTGTLEGRRATVYLLERADGSRTYEAVLEAPCATRHLR
jgi:hypothetical protein